MKDEHQRELERIKRHYEGILKTRESDVEFRSTAIKSFDKNSAANDRYRQQRERPDLSRERLIDRYSTQAQDRDRSMRSDISPSHSSNRLKISVPQAIPSPSNGFQGQYPPVSPTQAYNHRIY